MEQKRETAGCAEFVSQAKQGQLMNWESGQEEVWLEKRDDERAKRPEPRDSAVNAHVYLQGNDCKSNVTNCN